MMFDWILVFLIPIWLVFSPVASSPLPISGEIQVRNDLNDGRHWVGIWTAMPQLVEPANLPPTPFVCICQPSTEKTEPRAQG